MADGEKIIPINIEEEMKSKYIDYSMSVIVSRALPDVRDGLKPVHRRVLYGMHELGVTSTKAYKKSALRWHPDKNRDNPEEASKKFQEIISKELKEPARAQKKLISPPVEECES